MPTPQRRSNQEGLTPRELEVLAAMARGANNRALAEILSVTPATARSHAQNILRKLGAHSRLEAVAIATARGLLPENGATS